eukprot:scaffold8.g1646.t1
MQAHASPSRPAAAALFLLLAAAALRPSVACSSFIVNCAPDGGAVVTGRTLDFSADLTAQTNITLFPAALPFTGVQPYEGAAAPTWNFKHTFVVSAVGAHLGLDGPLIAWDGLNDAGLAVGLLWQSNVTFKHKYNASGPSQAIVVSDVIYYLLGSFATVAEARAYLDPVKLQIILRPKLKNAIDTIFKSDPDLPKPDADGTIAWGTHFHITDANGDGLLLEGTPDGGFAVYETPVLTNEPAFPLMRAWMAAYNNYSFASVPGIANAPATPWVEPWVIPFNSARDSHDASYFGSQSRFLRLSLQLQDCSDWAWPNATWSPAGATDDPQTLALKRGENWLASILVPMSQLGQGEPDGTVYATQIAFLRDNTGAIYYYRTPGNNGWLAVDLPALAEVRDVRYFPLAETAPEVPFAADVTSMGQAA